MRHAASLRPHHSAIDASGILRAPAAAAPVEYQQLGRKVPCRVVYHRPPRAPNGLWKAQAQVGFYESRAEELVETLERSGWSCDEIQDVVATDAGRVRTAAAEPLPDEESELQSFASLRTQAERAEAVTSGEAARSERAIPPLAPTTAETAGPVWKSAPSEAVNRSGATAASQQRGRGERSGDVVLADTLARDIRKLEESTDAEAQAGNVGVRDLNGDGQPDAAVLITFVFGGTHYVQSLVAYMYRQGTCQPAARRFIGASDRSLRCWRRRHTGNSLSSSIRLRARSPQMARRWSPRPLRRTRRPAPHGLSSPAIRIPRVLQPITWSSHSGAPRWWQTN
jgi:hypothetical protein